MTEIYHDPFVHGVVGTSLEDPSGAKRAQEAHDAGAVVPPLEVPSFTVHLEFRVRAPELEVQELASALGGVLLNHPQVEGAVATTVTPREVSP